MASDGVACRGRDKRAFSRLGATMAPLLSPARRTPLLMVTLLIWERVAHPDGGKPLRRSPMRPRCRRCATSSKTLPSHDGGSVPYAPMAPRNHQVGGFGLSSSKRGGWPLLHWVSAGAPRLSASRVFALTCKPLTYRDGGAPFLCRASPSRSLSQPTPVSHVMSYTMWEKWIPTGEALASSAP